MRFYFTLAGNGLPLQEVGDFEAQKCLQALNLIRSTRFYLTTEPPISCRYCYALVLLFLSSVLFSSRCFAINVQYLKIVSHFYFSIRKFYTNRKTLRGWTF